MIAVVLVLLCAFFRSSETFLLRKSPFISSFRPRISENRANSQLLALATQSPVANAAINQPVNPEGDIRPTTTDRARTVTYVCTSGTLCTTSVMEELNGAPFGSYVDYILDEKGWPVMLLSDQSMHTQNIKQQPLVSLFCQLPRSQSTQSSAGLSRVTIMGEIERVAEEELATLKLAFTIIHPYAEQIADSPRFSFYKIRPKKIYFSGGFGVMATFVDVPQYEAAKPDVLAQEVANVLSRVNLEKQTELLLLCKTFLGIEDVEFVRVQAVDRLGIDLRVKAGDFTDEYRIGFRHSVNSAEDAKSELVKLFQEAWERQQYSFYTDEKPRVKKYAEDILRQQRQQQQNTEQKSSN